jgi:hypothetical protein
MFGTGEYTDVIDVSSYTGSISELYKDGVIVDIAKYLDYMPNLKKWIETDDEVRRSAYNDDGQIFGMPDFAEDVTLQWGGMVYRRDILETMTGGNIAFPSGKTEPTTLADWDYMLPLFKAYFEAAGMGNSAVLILPYNGSWYYGDLCSGFGFHSQDYYVENGTVKHGLLSDGFYNYIIKMKEWYQAGYIYKDFATRTNDPFYLPNTELTYGGAAGIWYGMTNQLGTAMSMPEYGLNVVVNPLSTPIETGYTGGQIHHAVSPKLGNTKSPVITTQCKDIPKVLSVLDYMYSQEGGMMWEYGLTKEQIPEGDTIYAKAGLSEGTYWFEGDTLVWNPVIAEKGIAYTELTGRRLTGYCPNSAGIASSEQFLKDADKTWTMYDSNDIIKVPTGLSYSSDDEKKIRENNVKITDYANSMISKFIMGTEKFDEAAFEAFKNQLIAYGIQDNIDLMQASYARFMAR